jgi:nitric oxide dioxygenase
VLSQRSAATVRATLPAVRGAVMEIAGRFYESMFAEHPGLLNLFNRGSRASGEQRKALAGAVVAYAEHLTGTGDVPMRPVVSRIAHKHVSLGIKPEQYTVVGRHLLGAVKEVLGEAVTPEVASAWDEVYWLFAVRLIAAETRAYQQNGVDPHRVSTPWKVVGRIEEAEDAVSLLLAPTFGGVPEHRPGQYVTVTVDLGDGVVQARQYTLSRAPGHDTLRITVRRVRGRGDAPDGAVSTFLTRQVRVGDLVGLSHPAGDTVLDTGTGPLILVSAGIGITPIAAVLEHVAAMRPERPVIAVHAEREPGRHALREHVEEQAARLESFDGTVCYQGGDLPPGAISGRVVPDDIPVPPDATAYLCGPLPFMRDVRTSLLRRGMPADRVHFEVFGSDLWTTGAEQLPDPAPTVVG